MNPIRAGVLAGLTVAAAVAVGFGPLAVSLPGGLLLAFVLPGLALSEAVLRPGRRDVGRAERAVLVPSLSLAVLVLGGLGLWSAGGHLNRASWTLVCAVTTLVATGAAYYRSLRAEDPDVRPAAPGSAAARLPSPQSLIRSSYRLLHSVGQQARSSERLILDVLPLTLAVLLVAGAGVWSYADSVGTQHVTVSSLTAAPPGPADAAGNRVVQVSASGLASADGPWRVVWLGGGGTRIGARDVSPDETGAWTGQVTVPGDERITVNLFRGDDATAFRTLIIASQ